MDSPSRPKRSRPRRSLSLRTPLRKGLAGEPVSVDSPDIFCDSPGNLTASESRLNLCSTPVNHNNQRKRSMFIEEAVSPYLAAETSMDVSGLHCQSPGLMPTMSQEMRRVGVDVVWAWNSPKRHMNMDRGANQQEGAHPATRKRRKSFTVGSTTDGGVSGSQSSGCATGFYKIREQLLRAKKEDSLFMRLLQEDDFPSDVKVEADKPVIEETSKDVTLTRKLSDELLNDSDNDENLLIISQETEKKVMELEKEQQLKNQIPDGGGGGKKTASSVVQSREISFTVNDSFDQFLIDIPFDELLNRNAGALEETIVNTSSSTPMPRVVGGRKGSLSRTQSMPPDKKAPDSKPSSGSSTGSSYNTKASSSGNTSNSRIMARHESMPMSSRNRTARNTRDSGGSEDGAGPGCASKYSISNPSLPAMPISSSTESLLSTASSTEKTRVCSQMEIARKRQIAQERLKLRQRQQQQLKK